MTESESSDHSPSPSRPWRARRLAGRVLRRLGGGLLGVIVLLLLVFLLPPTRGWLLRAGLGLADARLPGALSWQRAVWTDLRHLEIENLLWTVRDDTLATIVHARLQLRVGALLSRELEVDTLRVDGARLDVARIRAAFPPAAPDTATAPGDASRRITLPGAALHCLAVRDLTVITPAFGDVFVPDLDAAFDLRPAHGRKGSLAVRLVRAPGLAAAWRAEAHWDDGIVVAFSPLPIVSGAEAPRAAGLPLTGSLRLPRTTITALRAGSRWPGLDLEGFAVTGALGTASVTAHIAEQDSGRFDIEVALVRPPADLARDVAAMVPDSLRARVVWLLTDGWPAADPHLEVHAVVTPPPAGSRATAARVAGRATFVLPGPADLAFLLPDSLQLADLGAIAGRVDGAWDGRRRPPAYRMDLDLSATEWLRAGRLRAGGQGRHVQVEELALGMRGLSVTARGALDSTAVDLAAEVVLPDLSLARRRSGLLPGFAGARARLNLAVHGDLTGYPDSARADVRLRAALDTSALDLAGEIALARNGARLPAVWAKLDTVRVRRGERQFSLASPCSLAWDPADSALSLRGLHLEGRLGHLRADAWARRDSLSVDLDVDLAASLDEVRPFLSPAQQARLPHGTAVAAGQVRLWGSRAAPQGSATVDLGLRDIPQHPAVALRGTAWLCAPGGTPGIPAPPDDAPARGLAADLALLVDDAPLVAITARMPATVSVRPPFLTPLDEPARVVVRGDHIELSRLAALAPPGMSLTGSLELDLSATGSARDPALAGRLAARDVRLRLADGSWFTAEGGVTAAGTVRSPDLQGAITIEQGLLRVPETPPPLLPAAGTALLWRGRAPGDTLAARAHAQAAAVEAAADSSTPAIAKAALRLTSPGGLWLRGRGLDLELKGDLWLQLEGGQTTLSGELSAVRGTFGLLGRNFTLERGTVTLESNVRELQPKLEISLTTQLETTKYWVRLTGTPTNMELALTSDPAMSEGDIMATLIFGRSLNELDEGQAGLVAQRSGEIATAYGAGRLQAIIADQLGLDLVRIDPHTKDASGASLTVGKYLSPKVLVSYEQTLAGVSAYIVHLEYLIKGGLKIHSAVSHGEQSGAELLWSRDH